MSNIITVAGRLMARQISLIATLSWSLLHIKGQYQCMFDEEQLRLDQKGSWPGVIGTMGATHLHSTVQGIIRGVRTADKNSRIS